MITPRQSEDLRMLALLRAHPRASALAEHVDWRRALLRGGNEDASAEEALLWLLGAGDESEVGGG